jgi:hypothetical protein
MRYLSTLSLLLAWSDLAPAQGGKVTFRDDHAVLAEGKPFFPIGLYYCAEEFEDESGKLLGRLKGLGFNTLGYYRWGTPNWKQELDRAHRHGLKVWVRGHNGFAVETPRDEKAALEQVRQLKGHPALLFWEFQDEPILNKVSIPASKKGYELVRKEDPDHPLLVVEWPGAVDRFHLWKGVGDVFATDLYPIPRKREYGKLPNHDITQVRDYLHALKKAHGGRPVSLVLQAWAWDPLADGEAGYPTVQESRFMAYQAVIHGACGLYYYGQVHCTRPNPAAALAGKSKDPKVARAEFEKCLALNQKFWRRHKPFFQELTQASRVFVLRDTPKGAGIELIAQAPAAGPGIECRAKGSGKEVYLLAVNADSRPHTATFRLPEALRGLKEVHVPFENRKIAVEGGTFTDPFPAYGTHVYATTPGLPR